ncbi:hypothetical protein GCM10018793_29020 [Streptomyces sulfonofaciens]|uniref:Uncharacterized protein n=1 Tax=Streptomyces sulfonofaciens TaxID=68272 RepID=A0A919G658_9ACTN|nr:hypothetical protein [Streptomyces sulfonofaciens]GHH78471.1 hypothetical protein GCM10018793_29020 [Streptomyces sulfonofaciens]
MNATLNRTILLFDIERFSHRDDVEQTYLRRMLYGIADRILENAGIDESLRNREDRGDGLLELIDPNAPLVELLRAVLTEAPSELRAVNRVTSSSAQIRLRVVVATGYVAYDGHGWVGSDLNHAFRLLNADELRDALKERSDDFVLCVSDGVHHGIVRHDHRGIPADDFHPVTLGSANGPLGAWVHGHVPASVRGRAPSGPGSARNLPVGEDGPGATGPRTTAFGGSQVNGDQIGVGGGTVHGDLVIGEAAFRKHSRGENR